MQGACGHGDGDAVMCRGACGHGDGDAVVCRGHVVMVMEMP